MTEYRAIFEKAAEGIIIAELESKRFRYANPAICKMLGYTEDELLVMGVADIHPKDGFDAVLALFNAQEQCNKIMGIEVPCLHKDGTVIFVEINSSQINIDNIPCNLGFFTDTTERKQAKEALQESEVRLRSIINNSPDGIYLFDDQGLIVQWNRSAESITMIAGDAALGRPVWDIYYDFVPEETKKPELREYFRTELLSYISRGVPKNSLLDTEIRLPDGARKVIQCNNFSFTLNDRVIFGVIFRDITRLKQAEAERERLITELQEALANVKTLSGLLPICAACNKIRTDTGYWEKIEHYISRHSDTEFTHGLCPTCAKKLYPDYCD